MRRSHTRSIASLFLVLVICAGCGAFSPGGSSAPLTDFAPATSRFDGHNWSPDGHWLAAESADNFITLFSADGQLVNTLSLGCSLGSGLEDTAWLPDGRLSCFVGAAPPLLGIFTLDHAGKVTDKTTIPVPINPAHGGVCHTMESSRVLAGNHRIQPGRDYPYPYVVHL